MESDQKLLLAELHRRSAAYRAGKTTARDVDDVMADLRNKQSTHTSKKSDQKQQS